MPQFSSKVVVKNHYNSPHSTVNMSIKQMNIPRTYDALIKNMTDSINESVRGQVQLVLGLKNKRTRSELMGSIFAIWCTGMNYVKTLGETDIKSMNDAFTAWYVSRLIHTKILRSRIQYSDDRIVALKQALLITD